jgi:hypothetical protein
MVLLGGKRGGARLRPLSEIDLRDGCREGDFLARRVLARLADPQT